MSTKPTRPRDEDDEEVTPYGVAFEAPHLPPPVSYPPDDDGELLPPEGDTPRKKTKRKPRPDGFGEVAGQHRDKTLERVDVPSGVPWWAEAAAIAAVGALSTLIAIVVIAARVKQANFAVGVFLCLVVVGAVVVQTVAVTGFLFLFGNFFGIDYGPIREAVVKVGATVVFVNGVTLFGSLMCVPMGLVAGSLAGFPVFWRLFKLGLQETLMSVALIALPACVLAAAIFAMMVTRAQGG